jgi:hypothetical protein
MAVDQTSEAWFISNLPQEINKGQNNIGKMNQSSDTKNHHMLQESKLKDLFL